jgi:hypothetical protein
MFGTIILMRSVLATSASAIQAIAATPVFGLDATDLKFSAIELQRQIDQLTSQQARVMFEADRTSAWKGSGARSMADWLAGKTKTSYGAAKKKQALGKAMNDSPDLKDAVDKGEVTPDAADQLLDAIENPPEGADPGDLIEACKGATPSEARDAAEKWRETYRAETEEQAEARRFANRGLRSTPAIDGQITITVTAPEVHARQVLSACSFLGGEPSATDTRTTAQRMCDGLLLLADAFAKGEVRGGREQPTILITIDADAFAGNTDEPGVTSFGDRVPAHVVRMLAENAILRRVVIAGSVVLDMGRQVRRATHDQYLALVARDGGCRLPECSIPASWCEVDHLVDDIFGGPTDLSNLVLWCSYHHHLRHLPGAKVIGDAHDLWLQRPDGTKVHCPPKRRTEKAAA